MGFFDKFLDAVRVSDDDYDDDDDFFDDEEYDDYDEEDEQPKRRFFSKLGSGKKDADEYDDFEDDDFDEQPEPTPVRKTEPKASGTYQSSVKMATKPASSTSTATSSKVTPIRKGRASSGGSMEVCVIKPTKVEDFREIADTLLSYCTVVLNLEGIDVELAQRIIDFSSGSCYAIGGGLQKVSSYIFILTPSNVEITGDIQDLLGGAIPSMRTSY